MVFVFINRVTNHLGPDIQIARRSAIGAGLAPAGKPQFFAGNPPLGNLHRQLLAAAGGRLQRNCFRGPVKNVLYGNRQFRLDIPALHLGGVLLTAPAAPEAKNRLRIKRKPGAAAAGGLSAASEIGKKRSPAESELPQNIVDIGAPENIFLGISLLEILGPIGVILFSLFLIA